MQGLINRIRYMAMAALLVVAATACVHDKGDEPVANEAALLCVSIRLPQMRSAAGDAAGYESGQGVENYIDNSSQGLRIYLFDTANKFLTRFTPMGVYASESKDPGEYTAVGKLPAAVESISSFKVVVLANWPAYSDDNLTPGISSIDDLCNAEWAQFTCLASFDLNPDEGRVIPFFGVHEYSGVTFEKGKRTTLTEPVALLRAMAKVELVLDNDGTTMSNVVLRGFNQSGYCAPAGVYSQSDYNHNGQWSEDYVKTLHLPGGVNSAAQGSSVLPLYCSKQRNGTQKETWVCYVPEYKNTNNADGTANYKARLEFKIVGQNPDAAPYEVYFTEYGSGKPIAGTDFDLCRNNCYRFVVTFNNGALVINVMKWENTYDNDFIFN